MRALRALLLLAALLAGTAHAFTLSGTVYGGSGAMTNAALTLFPSGSSTSLAETATNGAGLYAFTVSADTYDLRIVPPLGSPHATSFVTGIVVTTADVVQDVVLVAGVPRFVFTGFIRPVSGPAFSGEVKVTDSTLITPWDTSALGANGEFQLEFQTNDTLIGLLGTLSHTAMPGVNLGFSAASAVNPQVKTAYETTVPAPVTVSGRVVDPEGVPIAGVVMNFSGSDSAGDWRWTYSTQRTSAADGTYSVTLIPGYNNVALQPPPGGGFDNTFLQFPVSGAATGVDVTLQRIPAYTFTGYIRTSTGPGFSGTVRVTDSTCITPWDTSELDAGGNFTLDFNTSATLVCMNGSLTHPAMPGTNVFVTPDVAVNPTVKTVYQATVPAPVTMAGRVVDPEGVPVSGVTMNIWANSAAGDWRWSYSLSLTTALDGTYATTLVPGTHNLTLQPPSGGGFQQTPVAFDVTGAQANRDFVIQRLPSYTFTGFIRPASGPGFTGTVRVTDSTCITPMATSTLDANGAFSLQFQTNATLLCFLGTLAHPAMPGTTLTFSPAVAVNPAVKTIYEAVVPTPVAIAGKVTDNNSVPVTGTAVNFSATGNTAGDWGWNYALPASAGPDGAFGVVLIPGAHGLSITPPAGSGFTPAFIGSYPVASAAQLSIALAHPDVDAPRIISGPFARELTATRAVVEWLTDEPSNGAVIVNSTPHVEPGPARRQHSVVIAGLSPGTAYVAQVASSDPSGNGPATASVSFSTSLSTDSLPPVFIGGPIVTSVTSGGASVEWTTDEPATGVVGYGTSPALGSTLAAGTPLTVQRVSLTGLSPSTVHYVQATATDDFGNGPTPSGTLAFTTLAAADTTAPAIVGGPLVLELTATAATIAWTTNEPATSDVSWNNGVAYGLVTGTGLATQHSMRISPLLAGTAYNVTVSSKDASGNGPTLATVPVSTLSAGDTLPPVITCGPEALGVKRTSASIRWCTGEPADSRVLYGTSSVDLSRQQSRAVLETGHLVTLTALAAETTYHYRVESRDAAGNASAPGAVLSFTTPSGADAPLAFVDPPSVIYQSDTRITVQWTTNVPADATLECAPTAGGEVLRVTRAERLTAHQLTIPNLQPNLSYTCIARSADIAGNAVQQ